MKKATNSLKRATGPLPDATGFRHQWFASQLTSQFFRQRFGIRPAERVFKRRPAAFGLRTLNHAPEHHNTTFVTQKTALTLAPKVRIDLRLAPCAPLPDSRLGHGVSGLASARSGARAGHAPVTPLRVVNRRTAESGQPDRIVSRLRPVLTEFVASANRALPASIASAAMTPRRTRAQRVETVLKKTRVEVADRQRAAQSVSHRSSDLPPRLKRSPAIRDWPGALPEAAISDGQVTRITDQVVQQINRRIVARRERMGGA